MRQICVPLSRCVLFRLPTGRSVELDSVKGNLIRQLLLQLRHVNLLAEAAGYVHFVANFANKRIASGRII